MRRALLIFALGALVAPGLAHAQSGGSAPAGRTVTAPAPAPAPASGSLANAGGTAPDTSPAGRGATGGNTASRPFRIPPVIRSFSASPRSQVWGSPPTRLRFRVDATNLDFVRVVLGVRRSGSRTERKVSLGRVRTGRAVVRSWSRRGIAPGTYRLALRVVDARGRSLARVATATITVKVRPRPKPAPAPTPSAPSGSGVFPVLGPVTWGDGFGVDRGDHKHGGQDLAAASGTPVVSPRRGTVVGTGYGSGSGNYVVVKDAERDNSYVFYHLLSGSTVVSEGQSVSAGQRLASVGSTGHSTGPHLHFELWVGAWWGGGHGVDPAPFLRSLG
jgi:murein DD-endopeptidase MepM/ murein hydrolase activator NlpD